MVVLIGGRLSPPPGAANLWRCIQPLVGRMKYLPGRLDVIVAVKLLLNFIVCWPLVFPDRAITAGR